MAQEAAPNKRIARIAGALYLAMMPFAFFTLYVRMDMIPGATLTETTANILAAPGMFGAAIVTWLISQVSAGWACCC